MTKEEILNWYNSKSIGKAQIYTKGHSQNSIIKYDKSELRLLGDSFTASYGCMGGEFDIFEFEDYGKTWVFKKDISMLIKE